MNKNIRLTRSIVGFDSIQPVTSITSANYASCGKQYCNLAVTAAVADVLTKSMYTWETGTYN